MDHAPIETHPIPQQGLPPTEEMVARNRLRFLTAESVEPGGVREAILTSWWRSRQFDVPADRIELPYFDDQDLDTPLIHGAEPVLRRLGEQLDGQPISLILTDPAGVVLTQHTGDADLHRHLERVRLVPGFSYGEEFVGTNGIGTALEDGRPTHVFGHEHYAENLENLACAGVPIRHPISGKTIGAVDLTCWQKDAGRLLVALARTTAEQVRQALLTHSNLREMSLFQGYLQACRRTTGIVIAFNDDIVMMNDCAQQMLDPTDQSVLLDDARHALAVSRKSVGTVVLPSGGKARIRCRRVPGTTRDEVIGGVVSVQLVDIDDAGSGPAAMVPMFVPGLVGSTAVWMRCCHEVDACSASGEWLTLVGEHGAGKSAVARCVRQRHNPTGRIHTLDAGAATDDRWLDTVRQELLDDRPQALVIRDVELLPPATAEALTSVLSRVRAELGRTAPWVVVTVAAEAVTRPDLAGLLGLFSRTIEVPALRHHADDLRELVPFLLTRLCRGTQPTCSSAAMHLLMRARWPGNVAQLYGVLRQVVQHRRFGVIEPTDLPAEFRTTSRRSLNRLESMERDAIMQSLVDAGGNKARAAALLGMSRATIYRRIHEYGIVTPQH